MYNFFVNRNQINGENVEILGKDVNHITNVLRMPIGQKIYVCNKDTSESFLSEIKKIEKEKIICTIIQKNKSTELPVEVTVFQGLPKFDKLEYIIQKSVELGAYEIVPVEMKHCIAKLKDEDKKTGRWQLIAEAAAKQSKRNIIPKVERLIKFNILCEKIKEYDIAIVAYENEQNTTLKQILQGNPKANKIAIIIGPEGGISEEEVETLKNSGAKEATLGNRILRTETASLAMLSMITYEYEF